MIETYFASLARFGMVFIERIFVGYSTVLETGNILFQTIKRRKIVQVLPIASSISYIN
ncbi:MAG: hypothetical protein ACFFD4_16690 [Candidatus Odinarchaeota archaeon]